MNGDPSPLSDKANNFITGNRLAAAGNVVHQVADPFDHHASVIFTPVLRRIRFLLKLFQRRCVLFRRARFIELRLQEIHHLIQTDIAAANRREQFFHLVKVITRQ